MARISHPKPQGESGYSNPHIMVGDILRSVDGYTVEAVSVEELHTMLIGDEHTK